MEKTVRNKFFKQLGRKIGNLSPYFCNCQKTSDQHLHIFNGVRVIKILEGVSRHAKA